MKDNLSKTCKECNKDRKGRRVDPYAKGKICTKCSEFKDLQEFNRDISKSDGRHTWCKECVSKIHFQNKERNNKRGRDYYYNNREKCLAYSNEYYSDPKNDAQKTNNRLLRTYGISLIQYENTLESQNGKCAICDKDQKNLKKKLYVDHDHETGEVRGLLCDRCNRGLGYFKENKSFLLRAIKYLEKTNA